MTYLTPDERESASRPHRFAPTVPARDYWQVHASHAALDEMAHKMREELHDLHHWATSYYHTDPTVNEMLTRSAGVLREYDKMIGDNT